jgi:peptide/nickel transport system substrate-binding protein/oligopeptide transport system substrate-binding protein
MKILKWAVLVVLSASLFLACTSGECLSGHVYYRLKTDPTTLDPALVVDVTGGSIAAKLFNGLVRLGDDLSVVPDIASKWTISKDGRVYRFSLRSGVKFSNGREVKAADFKYSFERVLSPETRSPRTWLFDYVLGAKEFMRGGVEEVKGIRALDDYTVEIILKEPFSPFIGLLTMTNAYVVPAEEVRRLGPDFSSHPVGTGPYVLKSWLPGREMVLEARSDYFGELSKVKGIVYRVIPEELTAEAEFELENLDAIAVPVAVFAKYKESPKWGEQITSAEGLNTYYLGLNCSRPPFDDPEIRRAVNLAVDREKILATVYEGRGKLASGPVPDVLRRWEAPEPYPYKPERAKAIIKQKGFFGKSVEFYINADPEVVDMAEVIQSYLNEVGLDVHLKQLEWSAFKQAINNGEADLFWLSWWADYPDPENFLFPLFHSENHGPGGNRVLYTNPEVDALIEKGQRAASENLRNDSYRRAETIIAAEAPWVFFWHRTDFMVRQPRLKRQRMYPVYSMDKGLDVELAEPK